MNIKSKRLIASILFVVFMMVTFSPVYASTEAYTEVNQYLLGESNLTTDKQVVEESEQATPYGLKKTLVVNALKYGGSLFAEIVDMIGDEAVAKMLKENAFAIGNYLETITDSFEANLIQFMAFELGLPISAARNIAWAICNVVL